MDDRGKVSGIIDWGDINIGHPACDLSIVYSFLPLQGRQTFFEEYGEVDDETKEQARLIGVFIAMIIMMLAIDDKNEKIAYEAKTAINRALS